MKTLTRWLLSLGVLVALLSCGSRAEVGGACSTAGATTAECVDGAICTNTSGSSASCRTICTEQSQCSGSQQCNGVSNSSTKSCQDP